MSLVRRKIYICDHCDAIKLAERYDAWESLKEQAESEDDNG